MFQIHPYPSIYTAYTSPQPYNRLSNLKSYKTHAFTSERLQIPLEMVQNWKKTFDEWRGRPVKAQPEVEGINNPYQAGIIDSLVIPHVVGRIIIHYETCLPSPVLRVRECHYGYLTNNIHFTIQNSRIILGRIKSGFSEVFKTLLYPFQKIPLILTIPTVLFLFPYLLWGMRNRSCPFLCLHALSWHPLDISGRMICR